MWHDVYGTHSVLVIDTVMPKVNKIHDIVVLDFGQPLQYLH